MLRAAILGAAAFVVLLVCQISAHAQDTGSGLTSDGRQLPVLKSAWYLYEPYEFIDTRRAGVLTGIDIEVARELSRRLGFHVEYAYMNWHEQTEAVGEGTIDFAEAARTDAGEKIGYFTEPYRIEEIVLLVAPGAAQGFADLDSAGTIEVLEKSDLTIGYVDGLSYGDNRLGEFVQRHVDGPKFVAAENSTLNIRALVEGEIDVALEDRTSAIRILSNEVLFDHVAEVRLTDHPHAEIAILFSKRTFAPEVVHHANAALETMKDEGFLDETTRKYLLPLLLNQTTGAAWYLIADFVGTVAFAVSGAVLAWRLNTNLAGFLMLSGLPAVGGGITRDVLLGREVWALSSVYPLAIFVGVALVFFAARKVIGATRRRAFVHKAGAILFNLFDAVGLASFTVTGVAITISDPIDHPFAWAPFMGALTAAGGGMARDAIVGRDVGTLYSDWYVQVSLLFGALLTAYLAVTPVRIEPNQFAVAVWLTMSAVVVARLAWLVRRGKIGEA